MKLERQSAVLLTLVSIGVAFGCSSGGGGGGGGGASLAPTTSGSTAAQTTSSSTVIPVAPVVTAAPVNPVVNAPSRYLYSASSTDDTVTPFTIDPKTGALKAGTAVPAALFTWSMCAHSSGKFLYVLGDSDVASFAIDDKTGNLQQIAGQTITIPGSTWGIACSPKGDFVLISDSDDLSSYTVGANGALTNAGTLTLTGHGCRNVVVDPSGKFAYVAASSMGSVDVVAIEAGTGNLKLASSVMLSPGCRPIDMDSTGKFVVVGNNQSNTVTVLSRDAQTGALTVVGTPLPLTGPAYAVTVAPSGKFVYAGCDESGNNVSSINQFSMDATGKLTPLAAPTAPGCDWPLGLAIDASGQFAYTPNFGVAANSVSAFTIDAKTGAMTANGTPVPTGADPHGIAIVK